LPEGFDDVLNHGRGATGKPADPGHGRLLGVSEEATEAEHEREDKHCRYWAHDVVSPNL
jgi:hypothetical protein